MWEGRVLLVYIDVAACGLIRSILISSFLAPASVEKNANFCSEPSRAIRPPTSPFTRTSLHGRRHVHIKRYIHGQVHRNTVNNANSRTWYMLYRVEREMECVMIPDANHGTWREKKTKSHSPYAHLVPSNPTTTTSRLGES